MMRDLAVEGRKSVMSLTGVNELMALLALVAQEGVAPGQTDEFIPASQGVAAVERLREVESLLAPESSVLDPAQVLDGIAGGEIAYSPRVFGYSEYSRSPGRVRFFDIPTGANGTPASLLGGAGLGVSSASTNIEEAVRYAAFVADPAIQRGLYARAIGQPGGLSAWTDPDLNDEFHGFYSETLASVSNATMRPRFFGWLRLQRELSEVLRDDSLGDPARLISRLNERFATAASRAGSELMGRLP